MKTINVKGEPFDEAGATILELKDATGKTRPYWDGVFSHIELPEGRFILPLYGHDFNMYWAILRRFKKNIKELIERVGFRVACDYEEKQLVASFAWEIDQWEKRQENRKNKAKIESSLTGGGAWTPKMRMLIPEIGTILRLEEDWTFSLHNERRNEHMLNLIGKTCEWQMSKEVYEVTIPAGTVLSVDRIYIRKGSEEYSSLTFFLRSGQDVEVVSGGKKYQTKTRSGKGVLRFWAKLADVNNMVVSALDASVKR